MEQQLLANKKWIGDLSLADAETLVRFGNESKRILEFGVGGSSQLLAQCKPDILISLDTSSEWIDITKAKISQLTNFTPVTFFNYSELKSVLGSQSLPFDMIFVDGIDNLRLAFAHETWASLKVGGVMIFHDTRRLQDAGNVLNLVLNNFAEVKSIDLNIADSRGITSNMSVVYKKVSEPYENWNLNEGKPMWAYHGHMSDIDTPLWEYPMTITEDVAEEPVVLPPVDTANLNLAIYSTYCGTTEKATFCQKAHSVYPSYFISNNTDVLAKAQELGWIPILLEGQEVVDYEVLSAMQSKIAKVLPHMIPELQKYDFLFYIDDKYTINEALVPELVKLLTSTNTPMAMKKHPFLDSNVMSEYTESLKQPRYYAQREKMAKYIADQVEAGFPLIADIHFATGCILRDMRHPDTIKINELWFENIQQCGIECQVSFFFVARQYPNIMVLPTNVFA